MAARLRRSAGVEDEDVASYIASFLSDMLSSSSTGGGGGGDGDDQTAEELGGGADPDADDADADGGGDADGESGGGDSGSGDCGGGDDDDDPWAVTDRLQMTVSLLRDFCGDALEERGAEPEVRNMRASYIQCPVLLTK